MRFRYCVVLALGCSVLAAPPASASRFNCPISLRSLIVGVAVVAGVTRIAVLEDRHAQDQKTIWALETSRRIDQDLQAWEAELAKLTPSEQEEQIQSLLTPRRIFDEKTAKKILAHASPKLRMEILGAEQTRLISDPNTFGYLTYDATVLDYVLPSISQAVADSGGELAPDGMELLTDGLLTSLEHSDLEDRLDRIQVMLEKYPKELQPNFPDIRLRLIEAFHAASLQKQATILPSFQREPLDLIRADYENLIVEMFRGDGKGSVYWRVGEVFKQLPGLSTEAKQRASTTIQEKLREDRNNGFAWRGLSIVDPKAFDKLVVDRLNEIAADAEAAALYDRPFEYRELVRWQISKAPAGSVPANLK